PRYECRPERADACESDPRAIPERSQWAARRRADTAQPQQPQDTGTRAGSAASARRRRSERTGRARDSRAAEDARATLRTPARASGEGKTYKTERTRTQEKAEQSAGARPPP